MLLLTHPGQSQGRWLGLKLMIQILAKLLNTEIMDRTVLNLNINFYSPSEILLTYFRRSPTLPWGPRGR